MSILNQIGEAAAPGIGQAVVDRMKEETLHRGDLFRIINHDQAVTREVGRVAQAKGWGMTSDEALTFRAPYGQSVTINTNQVPAQQAPASAAPVSASPNASSAGVGGTGQPVPASYPATIPFPTMASQGQNLTPATLAKASGGWIKVAATGLLAAAAGSGGMLAYTQLTKPAPAPVQVEPIKLDLKYSIDPDKGFQINPVDPGKANK